MIKTCRTFASRGRPPVFASSICLIRVTAPSRGSALDPAVPILIRDYATARSLPRSCLRSLEN